MGVGNVLYSYVRFVCAFVLFCYQNPLNIIIMPSLRSSDIITLGGALNAESCSPLWQDWQHQLFDLHFFLKKIKTQNLCNNNNNNI